MRILAYILSLSLFLASCGSRKIAKSPSATDSKGSSANLSNDRKLEFTARFFDANKEKILGNYDPAIKLYLQCIKIDPSNAAPYYEVANLLNAQNRISDALSYAKTAAEIDQDNIWYQLLFAETLKRGNKNEEAVKIYEKLVKNNPDRLDFYFELTGTLLNMGKYSEAVKVLDKLESKQGISEEISIQKKAIYLKQGNLEKAAQELQNLIKAYPDEVRYLGQLGDLYNANGLTDKALDIYKKVLEKEPANPFIHLSLADYYRGIGDKEKAFNELKLAFKGADLSIDTKINILLSYYTITETVKSLKDQAFELSKILVETHPSDAKSYSIYGDFLYRDGRLKDARDNFRSAISLDKSRYPLWNQLLVIESELLDFDAMLKESDEAKELFPNQPLIFLLNGIALIQTKEYEKAIEVLQEGKINVVENNSLLAQFHANLGDAYNYLKKYSESDSNYDKALELEPDNIYVLNNYSYYLSIRGEKLDRAEIMSLRSNTLVPNNASYIDTYAWVLYKAKKYNEAKALLEKALANGGDKNSVILEHYGDVLYQLNEIEKAFQYWKTASENGKASDLLDKKLADKKMYE